MLMAREFCMMRRSVGFEAGSAPPALTAMLMSLAMRAKPLAMRFQRANMACLRTSKMRPMATPASAATPAGSGSCHCRRTECRLVGDAMDDLVAHIGRGADGDGFRAR